MWPFNRKTKPIPRRPVSVRVKAYAAAAVNRLTSDWNAPDSTADMEISRALPLLRQRARDMERNNDYIRRYFSLLLTNVIGHTGIRLQSRAYTAAGELDKAANTLIEAKWREWGKRGCTVCGRYTWLGVKQLVLRSVARDGEVLVYFPPRWTRNAAKFAIQLIEADHLDVTYNDELANGNTIRMGVEFDKYRCPVAYHLLSKHPADNSGYTKGQERTRYPARDILHIRRPERIDETRSVPWITSVSPRLKQIAAAEEAEVVAWRIAASKMGFYIKGEDGSGYDGDDTDENGTPITEAEPGTFETLETGWDFKEWNPEKPASTVESFLKAELRGVSSGLNTSYVALSNNLEGVSFSSIRSGEMADRDAWRVLQTWLIEDLCQEVAERWLKTSLLSEFVPLNPGDFDRLNAFVWRPRGWRWVDPLKDANAARADVELGIEAIYDLAAERGNDLEDVFEANKLAKELAESYGLTLSALAPKESGNVQRPVKNSAE